jgi:hypothetical protein
LQNKLCVSEQSDALVNHIQLVIIYILNYDTIDVNENGYT